jgi:major membrane immunogen (membrane-anchored lipoprotein)
VNAMAAPAQVRNTANNFYANAGPGAANDADLATALGIDATKLQEAYKAAWAEALKQAVADGKITQSQADQMSQNGKMRGFGPEGGWLPSAGIDFNALLAKQLNITTDQLTAAYAKAFTAKIDQAVKDGKMTQEQADLAKGRYTLSTNQKFQDALKAAYEAAINQAVKDGLITQSQADLILKNSTGPGFGPGMRGKGGMKGGFPGSMEPGMGGGPGGRGRHAGDWNGQKQTDPNNMTPIQPTPTPGTGT